MEEKIITLDNDVKIKEDTTITDDQVHEIYEALASEDMASTSALNNASKETENTNYNTSEEVQIGDNINPGINISDTNKITEKDYKEVFKEYNITNAEATAMIKLIDQFKKKENINFYNNLPKIFKNIADGMVQMSAKQGKIISKNSAAKMVIDEIMHDSEYVNTMNEFQSEMYEVANEMNSEYNKIYLDALEETFSNIDKIEIENPEKAKRIRDVKAAFDNAATFEKQIELAKNIGKNKLIKLTKRYSSETIYFNTKVNVTDVKIPDICELLPIIHRELPQFEIEDIKKFIVIICRSTMDMDVEHNVADLAYIYKLINNIYKYKFIENINDDATTSLFGNIAEVINYIINK